MRHRAVLCFERVVLPLRCLGAGGDCVVKNERFWDGFCAGALATSATVFVLVCAVWLIAGCAL